MRATRRRRSRRSAGRDIRFRHLDQEHRPMNVTQCQVRVPRTDSAQVVANLNTTSNRNSLGTTATGDIVAAALRGPHDAAEAASIVSNLNTTTNRNTLGTTATGEIISSALQGPNDASAAASIVSQLNTTSNRNSLGTTATAQIIVAALAGKLEG
jgi:hypothetical protein